MRRRTAHLKLDCEAGRDTRRRCKRDAQGLSWRDLKALERIMREDEPGSAWSVALTAEWRRRRAAVMRAWWANAGEEARRRHQIRCGRYKRAVLAA